MSDRILFSFDEDGNPYSVYAADDAAGVQRAFFLDLIDMIGDESPDYSEVMPLLMAVPQEFNRSVMSVTFAQLLILINRAYDFFEGNGIESKAEFRERWTRIIEDLGDGDDG